MNEMRPTIDELRTRRDRLNTQVATGLARYDAMGTSPDESLARAELLIMLHALERKSAELTVLIDTLSARADG